MKSFTKHSRKSMQNKMLMTVLKLSRISSIVATIQCHQNISAVFYKDFGLENVLNYLWCEVILVGFKRMLSYCLVSINGSWLTKLTPTRPDSAT